MRLHQLIHQEVRFDLALFCEHPTHRTVDSLFLCMSCPCQMAYTALTESVETLQGFGMSHCVLADGTLEPGLQLGFITGHSALFKSEYILLYCIVIKDSNKIDTG